MPGAAPLADAIEESFHRRARPHHTPSAFSAAILDDQGRFVVIRRADNGHWEPPGGVLELEESTEGGLVQEIAEETGLQVRPVALTGVYKNHEPRHRRARVPLRDQRRHPEHERRGPRNGVVAPGVPG